MKYTPAEIASITPAARNIAALICKWNGQTGTPAQVLKRLNAFGYFRDAAAAMEIMIRYTYERQKVRA